MSLHRLGLSRSYLRQYEQRIFQPLPMTIRHQNSSRLIRGSFYTSHATTSYSDPGSLPYPTVSAPRPWSHNHPTRVCILHRFPATPTSLPPLQTAVSRLRLGNDYAAHVLIQCSIAARAAISDILFVISRNVNTEPQINDVIAYAEAPGRKPRQNECGVGRCDSTLRFPDASAGTQIELLCRSVMRARY